MRVKTVAIVDEHNAIKELMTRHNQTEVFYEKKIKDLKKKFEEDIEKLKKENIEDIESILSQMVDYLCTIGKLPSDYSEEKYELNVNTKFMVVTLQEKTKKEKITFKEQGPSIHAIPLPENIIKAMIENEWNKNNDN